MLKILRRLQSKGIIDISRQLSTMATADAQCSSLSQRAVRVLSQGGGIFGSINAEVKKDPFHPVSNPKGKVNLGIAENKLCEEMVWAKMQEVAKLPEPMSSIAYGQYYGNDGFRQSLQKFLTKYFKPIVPIDFEDLFVIHGMTTAIENLTIALCEEGDYIMVMTPYYYRAKSDVWERAGVDIVTFPTLFPSPDGDSYTLDLREELLEDCYQKAKAQGKRIRAINLVNPTNPTGHTFTAMHIKTLLDFAHRHDIHVIANQIYGMTMYDPEVEYTSILSVPWPDPEKVHLLWACSKDFGLAGYRCAVLYTRNHSLQEYNRIVAYFTQTDELIQLRIKAILDDEEWVEKTWLPTLRSRLTERFEGVYQKLTPIGVKIHKPSGALFAWLDMRKFLPSPTEEGELWLLKEFVAGGVLMVPGTATGAPEPGFFRMVISLNNLRHSEGVKRVASILSRIAQHGSR